MGLHRVAATAGTLALVVAACSSGTSTGGVPVPTSVVASSTTAAPATEITTTTTVAPSTEPTSTTGLAAAATAAPQRTYEFAAVDEIVERFLADRALNGAGLVVVERDDGIVHERYWGEFDPDRVSLIASSSKMLTAGVLLHLADRGLLDVDAPVADYVDWAAGHNPEITVAQLVSSSSGLPGLLPDPTYPPYICQYLPVGDLEDCARQIFTTAEDDPDVVAPNTEFRYGGAQWQVAGGVAEAVSGRSWAELIDEVYVRPCGVASLGYANHFGQFQTGFAYPPQFDGDPAVLTDTDNPNMEGGAYLTAGDYAQLLLMHLRGGRCGDTQVLSEAAIARMHADEIGTAFGGVTTRGGGYGFGWWHDPASGRIDDPGAYGAYPWLDLDAGFGAYVVIEADSGTGAQLASELFSPVESAVLAAGAGD